MTKLCLKMFYCIFICLCINVHLYAVTGAPTHHLTISVEGDTPTLVVTSAEIGITPEVLQQTAKTTITAKGLPLTPIVKTSQTTTTTSAATIEKAVPNAQQISKNAGEYRKEFKNVAPKPKSKSTKSQYTKKRQQFLTKDKTIWREKNPIRPTEASTSATTTVATTTMADTTLATPNATVVTTPLNKASTEGAIEVAQTSVEPVPKLSEKNIGSEENQYKTTEHAMTETTKIPTAGVVAAKTVQVHDISETTTTSSNATTLGNMPRTTPTQSLPPDVLATTALKLENQTIDSTPIGLTTQSIANAISADSVINIRAMTLTTQQDDAKALPRATTEYTTEKIAKETDSATTAAVAMLITKTTVDTATTVDMATTLDTATTVDMATTAKTATISPAATLMDAVAQTAGVSEEILKMPVITTEPDIMTTTIEYTVVTASTAPSATTAKVEMRNIAQFNDSQIDEIVAATDSAKSINTLSNNSNNNVSTITMQSNLVAASLKTAHVIMTTELPQAINVLPTKQQQEQATQQEHHQEADSIKLIDLEKHDLEAIHALQQQKRYHPLDDGHDGVKKTKKKQLIDKHYLVDATDMPTTESGYNVTASRSSELQVITITTTPQTTIIPTTNEATLIDTTTVAVANTAKASTKVEATLIDLVTTTTDGRTAAAAALATAEAATEKSILNDEITTKVATTTENVKTTDTPTTTTTTTKQLSVNVPLDKLAQTTFPPSSTTTTFTPVHSGYLGPIFMGEKTFSVSHAASNRPHEQHESSIASRLRDGRIVEIIAPTALVEQTTIQHENLNEFTTAATTTTTTIGIPSLVEELTPVLSTTVFEVPKVTSSATRYPESKKWLSAQNTGNAGMPAALDNTLRTESKISDIQIEVYDSTIDSIVASTNFKDNEGYYSLPVEAAAGTTRPPLAVSTQERFTQYVVDRVDSSTPESNIIAPSGALGKPEPAAIEIHINVSEGIGNESEDLEFLYRQTDYNANTRSNSYSHYAAKNRNPISVKSYAANNAGGGQNGTSTTGNSDEVLVVEIIDTGENSTDNSASAENLNPIFTFRADADADVELKDVKYYNQNAVVKPPQMSDELFTADVKQAGSDGYLQPPPPPPPPPRKPNIDRDSDTIFYISNTEVKVGESLPTPNTSYEQLQQQLRKRRLEAQFFPANYKPPTTPPNAVKVRNPPLRYEEDIYLSPLQHTSDALKIFRSGLDGAPPLDVTYVGESVMEVEQQQSNSNGVGATTILPAQTPDVIIQPAILPEMSIGVPVIGELPPQIELKEIDFMPDEANQHRSGVYENDIEENVNGNDVDRLVESSIQYGGDLIDEGAGGIGFDGVEGSYPFGNPATLHRNAKHTAADYAHFILNHGVNNLRKDELSVDVGTSAEMQVGENATLKEYLTKNGNDTAMNISYAIAERMGNATAFSVMEEPNLGAGLELDFQNVYTLLIGLFIIIIPIVITLTMACALHYLYKKYQSNSSDSENGDAQQPNGKAAYDADGGEKGEDISRDARETKMHYNNADRDGFFVVEVARGVDSKAIPESPIGDGSDKRLPGCEDSIVRVKTEDEKVLRNHEQVQIHTPPAELQYNVNPTDQKVNLQQIREVEEHEELSPVQNSAEEEMNVEAISLTKHANTGLSQSDLSSTSSSDSNKRYSYGNQELYTVEQSGYVSATAHANLNFDLAVAVDDSNENDHKSENGHSLEQTATAVNNITEPELKKNASKLLQEEKSEEEEVSTPQELQVSDEVGNIKANGTEAEVLAEAETEAEAKATNKQVAEAENELKNAQQNQLVTETIAVTTEESNTTKDAEQCEQQTVKADEIVNCNTDNDVTEVVVVNGEVHSVNSVNGDGDLENAYDSLMSLPAPPTSEEITELNEFSLTDTNQLDSLPPPPPPLTDINDNGNEQLNVMETADLHATLMNGNTEKYNGHDNSCLSTIAQSLNVTSHGKMLPAPLTPPASPPTHFANGVANGICAPLPVVVDVNGS